MQRLSARSSRPVYMSTNPHSRAIWIFGMQPRANAPKCRYQTITLSVCVASWAHFRDIPMDITILLMFILTHKDQSAAQHMHKQRHQHTRFIEWSQREKKHDIDIYIYMYRERDDGITFWGAFAEATDRWCFSTYDNSRRCVLAAMHIFAH